MIAGAALMLRQSNGLRIIILEISGKFLFVGNGLPVFAFLIIAKEKFAANVLN